MTKHVEMIIDYTADGTDYKYNDNHGVLIRCRDCQYAWAVGNTRSYVCERVATPFRIELDDYCSMAKMRDEASDVVEVVRCKDCALYNKNDCYWNEYEKRNPDDFCSRGVKKDDGRPD